MTLRIRVNPNICFTIIFLVNKEKREFYSLNKLCFWALPNLNELLYKKENIMRRNLIITYL